MWASVEPFTPGIRELMPLAERLHNEVTTDPVRFPFDPDLALYKSLDAHGRVIYVTLREDRLVGFLTAFIMPDRASKGCLTLIGDSVYVLPEKRGRRGGLKLMRRLISEARKRNVDKLYFGTKKQHGELDRLLGVFGFEVEETCYLKRG